MYKAYTLRYAMYPDGYVTKPVIFALQIRPLYTMILK